MSKNSKSNTGESLELNENIKPVATIYYGENAKKVAQLETNQANANGKKIEHIHDDTKKLDNAINKKVSFNQSIESLNKSDLKELNKLKSDGFKLEIHDLSSAKNKISQTEKDNIAELNSIADNYKKSETPKVGRSYSGVIIAQGENTTIQKSPTGKFVTHENENIKDMKSNDTHRNKGITYTKENQTEIKSLGYYEAKQSKSNDNTKNNLSNSNSLER